MKIWRLLAKHAMRGLRRRSEWLLWGSAKIDRCSVCKASRDRLLRSRCHPHRTSSKGPACSETKFLSKGTDTLETPRRSRAAVLNTRCLVVTRIKADTGRSTDINPSPRNLPKFYSLDLEASTLLPNAEDISKGKAGHTRFAQHIGRCAQHHITRGFPNPSEEESGPSWLPDEWLVAPPAPPLP